MVAGGIELRNVRPYALDVMRLSSTTATPRSPLLRMRRPNPWRKRSTACGTAYCMNGCSYWLERAAKIGSVGTLKGSRATTSTLSVSLPTSTPSQNDAVPSRTALRWARKRASSCCGVPSMPCASTPMPRFGSTRRSFAAVARMAACDVKSAIVRPSAM